MSVPGEGEAGESFWEPGRYSRTVKRIDDGNRLCNELLGCFQERAQIEKQYAQMLTNWSKKWRSRVEKGSQYGTLEKAWQAFMLAADKLSELHLEMQRHLVDTAKRSYHGARKEERAAQIRESNGRADQSLAPDQLRKLQERVQRSSEEVAKSRDRYQKALEDLNKYNPKYMEDMEQVFDTCQDNERKRLRFFKEVLLDFHTHLDLSSVDSFRTIYRDMRQAIALASEQEDLRWWQNTHGPGVPMSWPQFEEWFPEANRAIHRKERFGQVTDEVTLTNVLPSRDSVPHSSPQNSGVRDYSSDWSEEDSPRRSVPMLGSEDAVKVAAVRVRALYDYMGLEADELSFSAGEEFLKIGEEDDQGWCKGQLNSGQAGLYPANYAVLVTS
ncbi:protein kinase C and casein kinase substrate in neurons protein 3 isoform X2 [Narcine bancroftii]|uniref:protein kinase C and casein kinase substrate in neurons protein 3 isoform X2 n=1 Tax=Narcine bancroftii TaxID=1343680 RepID=UPI00383215A3